MHLPSPLTRTTTTPLLAALLAVSACTAAPPAGPTILAQPGPGRSVTQFQADDAHCRSYATQTNGGVTPSQAATNSGLGTAAIGTLLGAAAGALLGAAGGSPGFGAAFGAGTGLLFGSAVGADNAQRSGAGFQASYDSSYAQCIQATGDRIILPPVVEYGGPAGYGGYAPVLMAAPPGPPGPPPGPPGPPPPPLPGW